MSSTYTLVVLETTHIQPYIFGSNRLKENIGASYLVKVATQDWVYTVIDELKFTSNLKKDSENRWIIDADKKIKEHNLTVEVLYAGGGNTALLFDNSDDAIKFTRTLSRKVLRDARGLQVVFHHTNFNWDTESLAYAVSNAIKSLKSKRTEQPPRMGIGGLGVTAMCASTSLPATQLAQIDDKWQPVSAEVFTKRQYADDANRELQNLLPNYTYQFPFDFDKLGGTLGASNFIAVVHADGNGLGKIIQGLKEKFPDVSGNKGNRAYVTYMRDFSENVKAVAFEALKQTVELLIDRIEMIDGKPHIMPIGNQPPIEIKHDNEVRGYALPFRPLVSGGDDVTFVCDGRIAFDLTATFLNAFEKQSAKLLKMPLNACAGIAIVNTKYPFSRAYELADELCGNAKKTYHGQSVNAFDWHYTTGGLYDDLDGIRAREYQMNGRSLINRPIIISDNPQNPNGFALLQRVITGFQTNAWRDSRNKAKKLADAIRANLVGDFRKRYTELEIPPAPTEKTLYDALELIDLYIPLKK